MDDTALDYLESELRRMLRIFASPAEDQLASLRSLGPDGRGMEDVAREFEDDVYPAVPNLINAGRLTLTQMGAVALVDIALRGITLQSDDALWTDDAIRTLPIWDHVRDLARQALRELNEEDGREHLPLIG